MRINFQFGEEFIYVSYDTGTSSNIIHCEKNIYGSCIEAIEEITKKLKIDNIK